MRRMVVACWYTSDGQYAVYILTGHRAELCEVYGISRYTILGPAPLYKVTDRLVALGYGDGDLVPE